MILKDKLSIVINTCDKYYCALEPFFVLWKKYCSELDCNIFLNMEKNIYLDDKLNIININHDSSFAWSGRLKNTLEFIDTEYVVSLHEDYFMNDYVNIDKLTEYLYYLDNHRNVASLSLVHFSKQMDEKRTQSTLNDYEKRSPFSLYQLQTSGLWRKDVFYNYVRKTESPWQMESYGNLRTWVGQRYDYLVLKKNSKSAFSFVWENYGSAIWHGKWFMSLIDNLFKNNNIIVDYSALGIVDERSVNLNNDGSQNELSIWYIICCWFSRIKMFIGHLDYLFHK